MLFERFVTFITCQDSLFLFIVHVHIMYILIANVYCVIFYGSFTKYPSRPYSSPPLFCTPIWQISFALEQIWQFGFFVANKSGNLTSLSLTIIANLLFARRFAFLSRTNLAKFSLFLLLRVAKRPRHTFLVCLPLPCQNQNLPDAKSTYHLFFI